MVVRQLGSTEGPAEAGGLRVSWHKILKSVVFLRKCSLSKMLESIGRFEAMLGICSACAMKEHMLSKHKLLFLFLLSLLFSTTKEAPERAQEGVSCFTSPSSSLFDPASLRH